MLSRQHGSGSQLELLSVSHQTRFPRCRGLTTPWCRQLGRIAVSPPPNADSELSCAHDNRVPAASWNCCESNTKHGLQVVVSSRQHNSGSQRELLSPKQNKVSKSSCNHDNTVPAASWNCCQSHTKHGFQVVVRSRHHGAGS